MGGDQGGEGSAATEAFREAIKLDPKNAWLRLGAGTAEFLQRHDAEAKVLLEQALELDPKLTRARAQLAQVVKRQGDLREAIRLYELVATDVPDDGAVRDTLERWRRERDLHERMRLEVGDHFTVSFEGAEDAAMAAQAVESLNRAFWRITEVFGAYPARSIPVVLYSGEQFRDITRSPQWAAAAFDGTIRVPMRGAGKKGEDLDRVLAHEFSHALIRSLATRGLPTWLNEGLASVLEGDDHRVGVDDNRHGVEDSGADDAVGPIQQDERARCAGGVCRQRAGGAPAPRRSRRRGGRELVARSRQRRSLRGSLPASDTEIARGFPGVAPTALAPGAYRAYCATCVGVRTVRVPGAGCRVRLLFLLHDATVRSGINCDIQRQPGPKHAQ